MPFFIVLPMVGLDYNIQISVFICCQEKAGYHILSSHLKRTTDLQHQGTNRMFDLKECIYVTGINTPHFRKSADSSSRSKWQRRTKTCLYSFPSLRVIRAFFTTLDGKQMIKRRMTSRPFHISCLVCQKAFQQGRAG